MNVNEDLAEKKQIASKNPTHVILTLKLVNSSSSSNCIAASWWNISWHFNFPLLPDILVQFVALSFVGRQGENGVCSPS
ncbi:hypothetical protein T01_2628 [Trichinella spiralis]|uniref:Uncharacterized protein n=1 Tax=Trichinella spiralis TaxID=6334 RepID=A0A0V1B844_TRISP|nr:hypothetical protein T01_2628 [Trichinella spiralis]